MVATDTKQLLDRVFVISGIIQVGESVISQADVSVTKAESNNCFIIHCFKDNNYNHNLALWALVGNHPLHTQPTDWSVIC